MNDGLDVARGIMWSCLIGAAMWAVLIVGGITIAKAVL